MDTGWAALAPASAKAAPEQDAVLSDQTFQKWRDFILPRPFELEWTQVPWRPSFWEGVVEGQEKDRPLLLWIMNGHPLSET